MTDPPHRKPGPKPRECPISLAELRTRCKSESLRSLAASLGVSCGMVKRWLDEAGIAEQPAGKPRMKCPISLEELRRRYASESIETLATSLGAPRREVRGWLDDAGVVVVRRSGREQACPISAEELRDLYAQGTVESVAASLKSSPRPVRRWLKEAGIDLRPRQGWERKECPISAAELAQLYASGTVQDIAMSFGVAHGTVRRWMDEMGIDKRPRARVRVQDRTDTGKRLTGSFVGRLGITRLKLQRRLSDGEAVTQIAASLGVSHEALARAMSRDGISGEQAQFGARRRGQPVTWDTVSMTPERVTQGFQRGMTRTEMAAALGIVPSTLARLMREAGIVAPWRTARERSPRP